MPELFSQGRQEFGKLPMPANHNRNSEKWLPRHCWLIVRGKQFPNPGFPIKIIPVRKHSFKDLVDVVNVFYFNLMIFQATDDVCRI